MSQADDTKGATTSSESAHGIEDLNCRVTNCAMHHELCDASWTVPCVTSTSLKGCDRSILLSHELCDASRTILGVTNYATRHELYRSREGRNVTNCIDHNLFTSHEGRNSILRERPHELYRWDTWVTNCINPCHELYKSLSRTV